MGDLELFFYGKPDNQKVTEDLAPGEVIGMAAVFVSRLVVWGVIFASLRR